MQVQMASMGPPQMISQQGVAIMSQQGQMQQAGGVSSFVFTLFLSVIQSVLFFLFCLRNEVGERCALRIYEVVFKNCEALFKS